MRTLGIDLASKPKNTAACVIVWHDGIADVESVETGVTNERIKALHESCDVTGIDAPFGWPKPFAEFVSKLDARLPVTVPDNLNKLYFRTTDHVVWRKTGKIPLAVAADKIAIPAMRCAAILSELGVSNRAGDGRTYEVYPAAALKQWNIDTKAPAADGLPGDLLSRMLNAMVEQCPGLRVSSGHRVLLSTNRDAFDSLVASAITRAAKCGLTCSPAGDEIETAMTEGWIAIPFAESLGKLTCWDCGQ